MQVTLPRRFVPPADHADCDHGLTVASCVICNGREPLARIKPTPLRITDLVEDPTWAEGVAILKLVAAPPISAQQAPKPQPTAECRSCRRKADQATRYRKLPSVIEAANRAVHKATHRVNGTPLCDECCNGRCDRCKHLVPARVEPGRRRSQSVHAMSIESAIFG